MAYMKSSLWKFIAKFADIYSYGKILTPGRVNYISSFTTTLSNASCGVIFSA